MHIFLSTFKVQFNMHDSKCSYVHFDQKCTGIRNTRVEIFTY